MRLQFGLTDDFTNTQYASLAALIAYYQAENALAPLQSVTSAGKTGDFTLAEKLTQVILSILAGCQYISMVNTKLRPERKLAQVERIDRFADQSTLARALNELVHEQFDEHEVYRIDHYLGKETVQNLLVFRFANALFENSWNRSLVASVEITVGEHLGLESRAGYYDQAGAFRDMIQNHVTQVLTLVAMEPPAKLEADSIRDEKVKVLRSVVPIAADDVVFGQYVGGVIDGETVPGYLEEQGVAEDSVTETAVSLRLFIDNWRWQGVPFYLRTGKRIPERLTQIVVRFREPPVCLFEVNGTCDVHSDAIVISLQPNEGFELLFDVKAPEEDMRLQTVPLEFRYDDAFGSLPDAYETLIEDVVLGDQTLFVRSDEVEAAWSLYQPILDAPPGPEPYAAGTWGPPGSTKLPYDTGDRWWQG